MYLAGSIGVAVEEMWRLAVAMASLKYIAQVVRQEVQRDIIDTGIFKWSFVGKGIILILHR